jgi:hypothetical protein
MKERKLRPDFVEREKALKLLARQDTKAADTAEVKGLPAPAPLLPKAEVSGIPWMAPDLSRSERVRVFCESFTITSGPDVGKLFLMRDWQRKFIEDVYREENGVRPVRRGVERALSVRSTGRIDGLVALTMAIGVAPLQAKPIDIEALIA